MKVRCQLWIKQPNQKASSFPETTIDLEEAQKALTKMVIDGRTNNTRAMLLIKEIIDEG